MKLTIRRLENIFGPTLGVVMLDDDLIIGFSLEDDQYIIPEGAYTFNRYDSPKFKYQLWMSKIDEKTIELHKGNTQEDTEGCILLGEAIGWLGDNRAVLRSKQAFDNLMGLTENIDVLEVEVVGIGG